MTLFCFPLRLALALLCLLPLPAQAAVTATFWSHEFGNEFPHAFFTLRGTPDSGGAPVDLAYGFTAKTVSPAILWGSVPGKIDYVKPGYMRRSDAQFSVVLSDAQYTSLLALVAAWDPSRGGNGTYNLNRRNCVHFVQEAARRVGASQVQFPKLMKKPRSFLKAVAAANPQVRVIALDGDAYLATLPPLG